MDDDKFFEVLPVAEMRTQFIRLTKFRQSSPFPRMCRKYYAAYLLAERWGISDDILRTDARDRASVIEIEL